MPETSNGLPNLDKSQLKRIASLSRIFSDRPYLKIEEGLDSMVVRWKQEDEPASVLKYYINSDLTLDQLETYRRSLDQAATIVAKTPQIENPIGVVTFQLVTIDQVQHFSYPDTQFCASKSMYIPGIELENLVYSLEYIVELLIDSEVDQAAIEKIRQFAIEWKDPSKKLKTEVTEAVRGLNTNLRQRFSSEEVGCDNINLKITANEEGYTIWITDIATSVLRFVKSLDGQTQ